MNRRPGGQETGPGRSPPDPATGSHRPIRRILLVGFMAAGKSTVGRLLGEALGWSFTDVDAEIERTTGRTIADIFRSDGEAAFRAMEARETTAALARTRAVLATGGGWAAQSGAWADLPPDSLVIWLRVSAREALRRVAGDATVRPLLNEPDPLDAARRLLAVREPSYARADWTIDVDGREPADIANEIRERIKDWNDES